MQAQTPLEPGLPAEWASLERRLRRSTAFAPLFYFVGDEGAALALFDAVRQHHTQFGRLQRIAVRRPETLVEGTLRAIYEATQRPMHSQAHVPVWVEALRGAGDPAWDEARRGLLKRLNVARSRLEAELPAPLVLLLPAGWLRETALLAPDLWHIRVHSDALGAAAVAAVEPAATANEAAFGFAAGVAGAHPLDQHAMQNTLHQWIERAQASMAAGEQADSLALLAQALPLARAIQGRRPGEAQARRDLTMVLRLLGQASHQARLAPSAAGWFQEAIVTQRQLALDSEAPEESHEDIASLLEESAVVAVELGQLETARRMLEEALQLRSQQVAPSPPQQRLLAAAHRQLAGVIQALRETRSADRHREQADQIEAQLAQPMNERQE